MRGSTIVLLYAQGDRGILFSPVHPPHHLGGVLLSCYHMPRAAQDYFSPQSPPPPPMRCSTILLSYAQGSRGLLVTPVHHPTPMRGSTLLLSYAKGSRGLLITPVHPPIRGSTNLLSYTTGNRELLFTPVPLTRMRGYTLPLSYAKGSRGPLITPVHPPPPYEWFYYRFIICPRREGTIILPCSPPTPPMRCSTLLLSNTKGSRELLITRVHPLPL